MSSRMMTGLTGALCLALLMVVWLRRSDEVTSPAVESDRAAPAKKIPASMHQKPRALLLGQSAPRRDADGGDQAGRHGAEYGLEARPDEEMPDEAATDEEDTDEEDTDEIKYWREVVRSDPDPERRIAALTELDYGDSRTVKVISLALRDRNAAVRLAALEELDSSTDEPRLDLLAPLVHDPDPEVRLEAVRVIADSDEPYAEELLYEALVDYDEDVHYEAGLALDLEEDEIS